MFVTDRFVQNLQVQYKPILLGLYFHQDEMRIEAPTFLMFWDLDNDFLLNQILKQVCHCGSFFPVFRKICDLKTAWGAGGPKKTLRTGLQYFFPPLWLKGRQPSTTGMILLLFLRVLFGGGSKENSPLPL